MRILIADDDITSRTLLSAVLRKNGHEIVEARDGVEALAALLREDAPRVGVLDWVMPEIDGVEGLANVIVASRCLDSSHEAHAAIRITPQVVAIGQAAGTAAAMCVKQGLASTRDLDTTALREDLRRQGAFV